MNLWYWIQGGYFRYGLPLLRPQHAFLVISIQNTWEKPLDSTLSMIRRLIYPFHVRRAFTVQRWSACLKIECMAGFCLLHASCRSPNPCEFRVKYSGWFGNKPICLLRSESSADRLQMYCYYQMILNNYQHLSNTTLCRRGLRVRHGIPQITHFVRTKSHFQSMFHSPKNLGIWGSI